MLNTVFYLVLNMSVVATILALILIPLRFIKIIPRSVIYFLWSLVLIRLVIPFSFSSDLSIMNFCRALVKRVVIMPTQIHENGNLTISNVVRTAKTYFPITYKTDLLSRIFNVAAMIWVIVAFGAILLMMLLYYLSYKELCKATLVDGVLYTSNGVNSPIVHGILKQKVIIPCNLKDNKEELKYVILHEGVHIKRHDNLIRVIAIITACIHWFNPFIWIYLRIFIEDMELSCDSKAVNGLPLSERKNYASTLIRLSANSEKPFMVSGFGRNNLKLRILNVLNHKSLTKFSIALSILFIITISLVLITNPAQ